MGNNKTMILETENALWQKHLHIPVNSADKEKIIQNDNIFTLEATLFSLTLTHEHTIKIQHITYP